MFLLETNNYVSKNEKITHLVLYGKKNTRPRYIQTQSGLVEDQNYNMSKENYQNQSQ
jgi:hypothetical protein